MFDCDRNLALGLWLFIERNINVKVAFELDDVIAFSYFLLTTEQPNIKILL